MDKLSIIKANFRTAIDLKQKLLESKQIQKGICEISDLIIKCYENKGKVLFCGNGGSAADAQHLSSELSGRYYYDRPPLASEALHVNTSYITAVANDYSYDHIYARLVEGCANAGDVLIGLSTSGNSPNVINALKKAQEKGMTTIGFSGEGGGKMKAYSHHLIAIPSTDTPRIQECHMLIGHAICEIIEKTIFPQ